MALCEVHGGCKILDPGAEFQEPRTKALEFGSEAVGSWTEDLEIRLSGESAAALQY